MARAMPVLPLVASISVSPGLMVPRRSAPTIIDNAGRSFTEPAGLLPSSLARSVLDVRPGMRCRRTSGVLPTECSSVRFMEVKAPRAAGLPGAARGAESLLLLLLVLLRVLLVGILLRVGVGLGLLRFLLGVGFRLLGVRVGLGLGLLLVGLCLGLRFLRIGVGLGARLLL